MVKSSTEYVCQQCGYSTPRWMGQCPNCNTWNSLVETVVSTRKQRTAHSVQRSNVEPVKLSEVKKEAYAKRTSTGIAELDRVLGGGIVGGMVTLLAGEPGIGKSTLLLQIADNIGRKSSIGKGNDARIGNEVRNTKTPNDTSFATDNRPDVIYVAGEESAAQIANRANRLGVKSTHISVLEETDVDDVIQHLEGRLSVVSSGNGSQPTTHNLSLVIIDSIQTMTTGDLTGTAGSVGQVRECTARLTSWAKKNHIPVFIVGHVTKEGTIAGPRVLEHMVDCVLWFEGERSEFLRVIRAVKNRFGATDEVGVFTMEEKGLIEVDNPSELFIGGIGDIGGQAVAVVLEGSRPMLVEIQALVAPTKLAFPKRSASGVDPRRLELIVAVLSRRVGIPLWDYDVFVNVTGGIRLADPASDLAVAMAIATAFHDKPLPRGSVAVGEVGLLGEVRDVLQRERRVKEARRLGYKTPITSKEARTVGEAIRKYITSK